jgi:hypothetical protein
MTHVTIGSLAATVQSVHRQASRPKKESVSDSRGRGRTTTAKAKATKNEEEKKKARACVHIPK